MIDVIKMTPAEYSAQSRDYQVLARLYSALFNVSKSYIDSLHVWNNNIDNKLVTLRSRTLNFVARHAWDEDDLEAVTSCFKYLMRNKGTMKALEYCVNILMKIENINGENIDELVTIDNYNVNIRVPENLLTIGILDDLINYILPAGLTFNIEIYRTTGLQNTLRTELVYEDGPIDYFEEYYSDKMYIGPSKDVDAESGERSILISNDDGVWLGLYSPDTEEWVPADDFTTGLQEAILNVINSEGDINYVTVTKDDGKKVEIIIPDKQSIKRKYITDTFVYLKDNGYYEDRGYKEEWEKDDEV